MAVGMAMAEKHMAAVYNRPGFPIFDNYTFTLMGDGCMMEGITGEAASIAGNLKLNKLIAIYDSNRITIEGTTDITFTADRKGSTEPYTSFKLSGITLQRNHVTMISGSFYNRQPTFSLTMNDAWGEEQSLVEF